jgi:hypothetical protein
MRLSLISSKSNPGWNQKPASSLVVIARETKRGRSAMATKFGFCGPTHTSRVCPAASMGR